MNDSFGCSIELKKKNPVYSNCSGGVEQDPLLGRIFSNLSSREPKNRQSSRTKEMGAYAPIALSI